MNGGEIMASGKLTNQVLSGLKKLEKNLAKEVAPEVNKLFKESVSFSLIDWYNDYDPRMYQRTNNFLSVANTATTTGQKNIVTMRVDSSRMTDYPGFEYPPYKGYEQQTLGAAYAFDMFFMNGEHGHGNWMMKQSLPPYMYVENDVFDGFGGRVQNVINRKMRQLLK